MTLLRSLLAWLVLLAVGFANGTLRQLTYARLMDDGLAHQLSCLTGAAALALAIAWLVRRWPLRSRAQAWATGALWLALTVAFETSFGLAEGRTWAAVLGDYAVWDGQLWPLVLLAVLLTPVLLQRRAGGAPRGQLAGGTP